MEDNISAPDQNNDRNNSPHSEPPPEPDGEVTIARGINRQSMTTPLAGHIRILEKKSGDFGYHYTDTVRKGESVSHKIIYLGKVVDREKGYFISRERGLFKYTLDAGYEEVQMDDSSRIIQAMYTQKDEILDFGDVWVFDEIVKQTGFDKVLNNIFPESKDTIYALAAFRTMQKDGPYKDAFNWYCRSYAKIIYPNACLKSQKISLFLPVLGQEYIVRNFFRMYLDYMMRNDRVSRQMSCPVLIDSTGLPNDIKIDETAVNNHNGIISHEIRLIYVADRSSGMPIYFRYISGNIIDNNTLIITLQELKAYNINVEYIIMDAGYYCEENITELTSAKIPFMVRMIPNRAIFKEIVNEHGNDLIDSKYLIKYKNRALFAKKIIITLYNKIFYAYLFHDISIGGDEGNRSLLKAIKDKSDNDTINNKIKFFGKFIILSSNDYDTNEVLGLYYARQHIEQIFDTAKNMANLLPLRVHSKEALEGHLLVSFMSTIVYMLINNRLSKSKECTFGALHNLSRLHVKVYPEGVKVIQEPLPSHREIIKTLGLELPFMVQSGRLEKAETLKSEGKTKQTKGRPKGSRNKSKLKSSQAETTSVPTGKRNRGRPKGSRNKSKLGANRQADTTTVPVGKRNRGRPKGSRNK
ncbi:MAG: transposase [Deltaproteobacteria bacterium]|jgi:hypothetical protein|nr:transposase [Deltaproteobacteria bacterium]